MRVHRVEDARFLAPCSITTTLRECVYKRFLQEDIYERWDISECTIQAKHIQLGHVMMMVDRVHCVCGRTLYAFLEKRDRGVMIALCCTRFQTNRHNQQKGEQTNK